jgi:hypothetical protein
VQYLAPTDVAAFNNTTNAAGVLTDDAPRVERSDYFDAGVSEQMTRAWTINVDGFYKYAHQLVDLGQFGDAFILSPYNYRVGTVYGSELSTTYKRDGFSAYGNFAWIETNAQDIDTQQFQFDSAELAYIQDHDIKLDHESEYTASAGVSYSWPHDLIYLDVTYGSGLRSGFANDAKEPEYCPINVGYQHTFNTGERTALKVRFDVINALDEVYQLRSGQGLGVNAPQYGQRRTFLLGMAYDF